MFQRSSAALLLFSLFAAGAASAQSQTPSEGDLPPLCDMTRFFFSSVSDDKDGDGDGERPRCPADEPREGGPVPAPEPFIPEIPRRAQN